MEREIQNKSKLGSGVQTGAGPVLRGSVQLCRIDDVIVTVWPHPLSLFLLVSFIRCEMKG